MAHRVAPQAEADLDDIWLYIAKGSGSMNVATRVADSIVVPMPDVPVIEISAPEPAVSQWASTSSFIASKETTSSFFVLFTVEVISRISLDN
jgi:hypothetical protein